MQTTKTLGELTAFRTGIEQSRAYVKYAVRCALNDGDPMTALAMSESDPQMRPHLDALRKAAIGSMTTVPGSPAGALGSAKPYGAAFLRLVALRAVIDRLLGRREVPPNIVLGQQTSGALVQWVGQTAATPVSLLEVESEALQPLKMATIVPITRELARFSTPSAEALVENDLARAVAAFTNTASLDPSIDAIPDVRPASLTHGATQVTPSGDLETDVALVLAALSDGNPESPYLTMSPRSALYLATRRSANGERLFPDLTFLGGSILGVPVLIATAGAGDRIIGIDAAGVAVCDLGLELDAAENVAVQLDTAPTNASGAPVPTTLVSLWQSNSIGIKAVRFLNWTRRDDAVAYLELTGSPLP
jgi:hypothetical protein